MTGERARGHSKVMLRMTSLLAASLSLAGCLSHTRSDPTDAGPRADARSTPAIDGGSCASQDARGEGGCELELGYVWRGTFCQSISGCSCAGADCSALARTEAECVSAHAACPRSCGGFAGTACLPAEYCDYPDGSFCGGDDSTGVCTPRPMGCPEPGGVTECGCDGREYAGECAAYLTGTDIVRVGPCVTTTAYDTASAARECAPDDGPAWRITLTTDRTSCDAAPDEGSIELVVWADLERAPSMYALGGTPARGYAQVCGRRGEPCASATGSIFVSVFARGEVARFDFDVRTEDGRRFAASDVEIARWWCGDAPLCG